LHNNFFQQQKIMATNFYQNTILSMMASADLIDADFSSDNTLYYHFNTAENTTDFDAIFANVKYFYVPVDDPALSTQTPALNSVTSSEIQSAGVVGAGLPDFREVDKANSGASHLELVKTVVNWYVTNKTSATIPTLTLEDTNFPMGELRDAAGHQGGSYLTTASWSSLFGGAAANAGNFTSIMLEDIIEKLVTEDQLLNTADSSTGATLQKSQIKAGTKLRIHMTYDITIDFTNTADKTQGLNNDDGTGGASHRWYNKTFPFTQGHDAATPPQPIVANAATPVADSSGQLPAGQMRHMRFRKVYEVTGTAASAADA
jgi:hypothetical protein